MIICKLGDRGDGIRQLQSDLLFMGYKLPRFGADGDYGGETQAALQTFYKVSGLQGDGKTVTQAQWLHLLRRVWLQHGVVNFAPHEFVCKCGKCAGLPSKGVDIAFLKLLQQVRKENGDRPLSVRSGYRCHAHNRAVGGAGQSQHMSNPLWAADILSPGISPRVLEVICDRVFARHGVGMGGNVIVHCDKRAGRTRWKYN